MRSMTSASPHARVFRPGLFDSRVAWGTGGGSIRHCVTHEPAALGALAAIGETPCVNPPLF